MIVGGIAAVGLVAVVFLGVRYRGQSGPGPLDTALTDWVAGWLGPYPGVSRILADFGEPVPVLLAIAVLAVVAWWRGRRVLALGAVVVPVLAATATTVLKPLVGRTFDDWLAYPSGHAAVVTALVGVAVLLARGRARAPVLGLATLAVLGTAAGLVERGYHYPTDTVGGIAVAVVLVCALRACEWRRNL